MSNRFYFISLVVLLEDCGVIKTYVSDYLCIYFVLLKHRITNKECWNIQKWMETRNHYLPAILSRGEEKDFWLITMLARIFTSCLVFVFNQCNKVVTDAWRVFIVEQENVGNERHRTWILLEENWDKIEIRCSYKFSTNMS